MPQTIAEKDVQALLLKEKVFRRRPGDVPYPLDFTTDLLDYDNWDHLFLLSCFRGLTMSQFETPPSLVLDLGCGGGLWVLEAARQWPASVIIGFDIRDNQPRLHELESYREIAFRVKWVHGNLLDGLPFPPDHFDFVRISRIGLGVPEDEWQSVLEEIFRVMKSEAILEIIEEDLIFPHSHVARQRPRPTPLTVDLPISDSLSSSTLSRNSVTTVSSNPWTYSQDDLIDLPLKKKTSLSPLHESPISTTPPLSAHFSPKSALSFKSHSSFLPPHNSRPSLAPSLAPPPPVSPYQTHPQDHSRLKAAWDAMLSRRFLAPRLITVLPFYLSSCFPDVKSHSPLQVYLPPNSTKTARGFSSRDTFDPVQQFHLERSIGRRSDSEEVSSGDSHQSSTKKIFSWAPMHLAKSVQTVMACKEAIWDEYANLYSPDMPPTTITARPKDGRVIMSTKSAAKESFDRAWSSWENDMMDRIGMRDNIMSHLLWAEPPGERPDWRVWRNNVDIINATDTHCQGDICRTLRGFVAWKPKPKGP